MSKGKEDSLVTRNLVPGESVYGEKRLVAESADGEDKRLGSKELFRLIHSINLSIQYHIYIII